MLFMLAGATASAAETNRFALQGYIDRAEQQFQLLSS